MVGLDEFTAEVKRLHAAQSALSTERLGDKIAAWWDLWARYYGQTSIEILRRMVDLSIKRDARVPSFAQFVATRSEAIGGDRQSFARTPCSVCLSTGVLTASRDGYDFAFRCHCCENWRGFFDGLPAWDTSMSLKAGYAVEKAVEWDAGNIAQLKGLALMREATPNLYAKVTHGHPEMVAAMEAFLETGWRPKAFESIPEVYGKEPMGEAEKERIRAASLRREAIREESIAVREPGDDTEDPFGDIGYEYRK